MRNDIVNLLGEGKPILKDNLEKGVHGITLNDGTTVSYTHLTLPTTPYV